MDAQLRIVRDVLKDRYPFKVDLAFPTYIPEGYKPITVDWVIDGPDQPNGYVKIIYWDKGSCHDLYFKVGRMQPMHCMERLCS